MSIQDAKTSPYHQEFLFNPDNLSQIIKFESDDSLTGYWLLQCYSSEDYQHPQTWYLGLSNGRLVSSGKEPMSLSNLLQIMERYTLRLRSGRVQKAIDTLKKELVSSHLRQQSETELVLAEKLYQYQLINPQEMERAVRLQILEDLDKILFDYTGRAQFKADADLTAQAPVIGFELQELMSEAQRRRLIWDQVKLLIPSLNSVVSINEEAVRAAQLDTKQERFLRSLMTQGDTPQAIAQAIAQDTLEIAKSLAKLVDKGLLKVQQPSSQKMTEILVIDDSPLLLEQFRSLVASWGYRVQAHSDPTTALNLILESNPAAIFLDINMPHLSGFDLLKQIRRHPQIAMTPLVMLTAERTLTNNWKAQWSGCRFLSKPLARHEIPRFKAELRDLLEAMMPQPSAAGSSQPPMTSLDRG